MRVIQVELRANPMNLGGGSDFVLLGFVGELAFYTTPVTESHNRGGFRLPARWINDGEGVFLRRTDTKTLRFDARLEERDLERLEEYRNGGDLHARPEGRFTVIARDAPLNGFEGVAQLREGWLNALVDALVTTGRNPSMELRCAGFELHPRKWNDLVYSKLRPSDKVYLEATLPSLQTARADAELVLSHLAEAERAYLEGKWPTVSREVYMVIEALNRLMDPLSERYSEMRRDRVLGSLKEVKALCNTDRHEAKDVYQKGGTPDRALAAYLLTTLKAAIGLVLA